MVSPSYSSAILGLPPPLFDSSISSVFSPHLFRMSLHGWFPDLSSNGPNKNVSFIKKKKEATFLRVSGNVCFPDLDVSPSFFLLLSCFLSKTRV